MATMQGEGHAASPASPSSGLLFSQNSGRILLRATSSTFTGGAVVLLPSQPEVRVTENTPLTQVNVNTRRNTRHEQMHQRLVSDALSFFSRFRVWIGITAVLILFLAILVVVLFFQALMATIFDSDKPCDQPLKYYMIVTLLWSQVPTLIKSVIFHYYEAGPIAKFFVSLILSLPGWFILGYGIYMVETSKTCHKTNPDLFYSLRFFIYSQVALSGIALVLTVVGVANMRRILLALSQLTDAPGCQEAVRKLSKVSKDAPELIDADDGQVLDCSICMDEIVNEEDTILRAPCGHYFHEECLMQWCKNHVDCPLCRQQIGEPDKVEEGQDQAQV